MSRGRTPSKLDTVARVTGTRSGMRRLLLRPSIHQTDRSTTSRTGASMRCLRHCFPTASRGVNRSSRSVLPTPRGFLTSHGASDFRLRVSTTRLLRRGARVSFACAITASTSGCEQARAVLARDGVDGKIVEADVFTPPSELHESFDVVFTLGVVEH